MLRIIDKDRTRILRAGHARGEGKRSRTGGQARNQGKFHLRRSK